MVSGLVGLRSDDLYLRLVEPLLLRGGDVFGGVGGRRHCLGSFENFLLVDAQPAYFLDLSDP
jgi:hypothetical protein